MNRLKNIGLVLCGLALGLSLSVPAAQAVESLKATLSTNRILVDGQEVRLTAYNINGNNYVMLRDIGRAVGFNVYWNSDAKCVQVESKKPYTGEAPVTSVEAKPVEQPAQTDVAAASDADLAVAGFHRLRRRNTQRNGAGPRRRDGRQRRLLSHPSGWAQEQHRHRQQMHWGKYSQYIGAVPRATAKNALRGGNQSVV